MAIGTGTRTSNSTPWYREPWPWILMAGPAAVVVAGAVTAAIAFHTEDSLVADDYYRQGLAINRELERERRARELNLSAVAVFSPGKIEVNIAGAGAPSLHLKLIHPTRAREDRDVMLLAQAGTYVAFTAEAALLNGEKRRVLLEDPAGRWRIVGSWNGREGAVRLQP